MGTTSKKVASVVLSVTTGVWMSGAMLLVPVAVHAQTTADLQAQIAALLAQITALQAQLNAQTGGGAAVSCNFTRDLTVGATGDDVKCLQQYLNSAGHQVAASGAGSPGNESMYFGSLTKAALAKWQAANGVAPSVGYFGPISRAKYNSLAAAAPGAPIAPGTPPVVVPGTGLAVSVASDNPASSSAPKGATNVTFLKFNIAGSGTVNTVVVKRTGAGATTDFDNVYLYDGANRLTSGRSLNSSSHEATFTNLNLEVSGVKTLMVVGDVKSTAAAADRNALQVSSVAATVSVSGVPASGNEMTIAGTTAGSVTLTKTGSISNPNIGQQGAKVSEFRVDAATEDAQVKRIGLFYAGTLSKSNLTNLVLKDQAGTVLGTSAGPNAKDLVVFELSSPLTILKGDSKTLSVYADIGGAAKKDDTIKLYIDEASDVFASGQQFGYGVSVTKTAFDSDASDHHVLTLQGATVTITFNGPNAGDVKKNGKDITFYDFTIASANNIEIRNLRFTNTASTTVNGPDDFKVVDVASGLVVAGPKDDASATVVFTDVFNINAGQSRRLKVTGDLDTNWLNDETFKVQLDAFAANDIKNLDNNQFLATSEVSPSTAIAGNLQTVKAPTLEVNVAGSPVANSFVKGTQDVPFVGFSFRAIADDIKITTIKVSSSPASGTLASAKSDILALRLFDGATQIGAQKSLTGDALPATATFDNLEYVIPKGQSKTLVVKANLSSAATVNNIHAVYIADVSTGTAGTDVVAVDTEGREPTYSGSDTPNNDLAVKITILSTGKMNLATAPDDSESKAGIHVAGTNKVVLSKFNFTAQDESLTVKKLKLLINNDDSTNASATSTDEVTKVYLYDGATQIGSTTGYVPVGAGASAGDVVIEDLSWLVGKDETKTLTVKGDIATIAAGADTGQEYYAHIQEEGFEATGAASTLTGFANQGGAKGKQKVVYKTYPTVEWAALSGSTLSTPVDLEVARFKVKANAAERIEWGAIGLQLSLLNASFSDVKLSVRDVTNGLDLTVGTQAPTSSSLDLTGDSTKSVIIYLTTPEQIAAGGERTYTVKIDATAAQFGTANETETLTSRLVLHNDSSTANIANAKTFSFGADARVDATLDSADNAFVWSDFSATAHAVSTSDWANGVYVDTFPGNVWTLTR